MKKLLSLIGLLLVVQNTAGADEVVIGSFDLPGKITFREVSNAVSYRVEWAPEAGAWTSFASSVALDHIPASGAGVVTASVPMLFRVLATVGDQVTNGPPRALTLPSADGLVEVTHPSIVAPGTNWNGYAYWMAYSGYPGLDRESTLLAKSHDGVNWIAYNGAGGNPVLFDINTELPPGGAYFYDPEVFLTTDGTMVCWTGAYVGGNNHWCAKVSVDGETWSDMRTMWIAPQASKTITSMQAVPMDDGSFRMYSTIAGTTAGLRDLEYVTVDHTGTNVLDATPVKVVLEKPWLWHGDVWRGNGSFHALFSKNTSTGKQYNWGVYGSSADGISWAWFEDRQALPRPEEGPGSLGWYKIDVCPSPGGSEAFDIVAGGWHPSDTPHAITPEHWRMAWIKGWTPPADP